MKKIKIFTVIFLLWCLFAYAIFAFVIADANPFNWTESTRGFMVFFIIIIYALFMYILNYEIE